MVLFFCETEIEKGCPGQRSRETGNTTYDLIKQLKVSLNAFFSQGIAKLFGHDLKDEYDPTQGQDKTIENIVQQIEQWEITS